MSPFVYKNAFSISHSTKVARTQPVHRFWILYPAVFKDTFPR